MTAKEQLRSRIDRMTDELAADLLHIADRRSLDDIQIDDEPETEEERAAVEEAKAELAAGAAAIPLEQIERRLQRR